MAVFDATALMYFLEPDAKTPNDPRTGRPISDAKERIDLLIRTLEARRETIVIPTPALSEVLVHADQAGPDYLNILNTTRCFRVEAFDQRAAVELAAMTRDALRDRNLRPDTQATRAKLKFDRQIIAIARTQRETTIYSDDSDIAKPLEMEVIPLHELPSPPEDLLTRLELEPDDESRKPDAGE